MVLEAARSHPVFVKDMCYYIVDHIHDDVEFIRRMTSTFLIRDPAQSIPSYYRLDPGVTLEEIGCEAQYRCFERFAGGHRTDAGRDRCRGPGRKSGPVPCTRIARRLVCRSSPRRWSGTPSCRRRGETWAAGTPTSPARRDSAGPGPRMASGWTPHPTSANTTSTTCPSTKGCGRTGSRQHRAPDSKAGKWECRQGHDTVKRRRNAMSAAAKDVRHDFTIRRLSPILGAEIVGLDASKPFDPHTMQALRDAFQAHPPALLPGPAARGRRVGGVLEAVRTARGVSGEGQDQGQDRGLPRRQRLAGRGTPRRGRRTCRLPAQQRTLAHRQLLPVHPLARLHHVRDRGAAGGRGRWRDGLLQHARGVRGAPRGDENAGSSRCTRCTPTARSGGSSPVCRRCRPTSATPCPRSPTR